MSEWPSPGSPPTVDQVNEWLDAQEDEHFEFKEAKRKFSKDDLLNYLCPLANEGGAGSKSPAIRAPGIDLTRTAALRRLCGHRAGPDPRRVSCLRADVFGTRRWARSTVVPDSRPSSAVSGGGS